MVAPLKIVFRKINTKVLSLLFYCDNGFAISQSQIFLEFGK